MGFHGNQPGAVQDMGSLATGGIIYTPTRWQKFFLLVDRYRYIERETQIFLGINMYSMSQRELLYSQVNTGGARYLNALVRVCD